MGATRSGTIQQSGAERFLPSSTQSTSMPAFFPLEIQQTCASHHLFSASLGISVGLLHLIYASTSNTYGNVT